MFTNPQINLYTADPSHLADFYRGLGFSETFRTPRDSDPIHIELALDGFVIGIAATASAPSHHGLQPSGEGRWIEIVLWADDTDGAYAALLAGGAPGLSPPHDWLDGRSRVAWVADPDGNPLQLVEKRRQG